MPAPVAGNDRQLADALSATGAAIARIQEQEAFFVEHGKREEFSRLVQRCCLQVYCSIQDCLRIILDGLVRSQSRDEVQNYMLDDEQSIKIARIQETLKKFNPDWERAYAAHEGKGAVDSIRVNRNRIAHCQPSGITIGMLRQWWEKSEEFLLHLRDLTGVQDARPSPTEDSPGGRAAT